MPSLYSSGKKSAVNTAETLAFYSYF